MHVLALAHGRPLRRGRSRARPRDAARDDRQHRAVLVADAVAGDGIGDARLLQPRRSRSHPVVARRRHARSSRCGSRRLRSRSSPWRWRLRPPSSTCSPHSAARAGLAPMAWSSPWGRRHLPWRLRSPSRLFRIIGPKRTRLLAQIVAAVIGAAFVIGLQVGAILSYGTMSRIAMLQSDAVLALAPEPTASCGGRPMPCSGTLRRSRPCSVQACCCWRSRSRSSRRASASTPWRWPRSAAPATPNARRAKTFRRASASATLAAQGMDADPARSLADLADADAASLPAAAGPAAVAQLRGRRRRRWFCSCRYW